MTRTISHRFRNAALTSVLVAAAATVLLNTSATPRHSDFPNAQAQHAHSHHHGPTKKHDMGWQ